MVRDVMKNYQEAFLKYGNNSVTYYSHLVGEHLLDIVENITDLGLSYPMISQQGNEQSNSAFKKCREVKKLFCILCHFGEVTVDTIHGTSLENEVI